ncbi:hypothetical protein [Streptomyces sp. NPDC088752]|uniref:hypothetical protein n=1 Tax=Streptomyces sp. NPDC088752 TaxID=3154963 RepID=UPI00341DA83C
MINFAPPAYGKAALHRSTPATPTAPAQTAPLSTAPTAPTKTGSTDLMDAPSNWDWRQLRDYVMRSIAERHGPQPAGDEIKIQSIFRSFAQRWGNQAGPIARFAFEQQDGFWRNAPVTASRFTKGNDPYFAGPISERLADA